MPTFEELQQRSTDLIRKGLEGSIFVKRAESGDDEITGLLGPSGLLALPTGYTDVGYTTKDQGATWTRDVETADVTSWGAAEPTRRDITSDVSGLQFTMQESKRATFELHEGVNLSGVEQDEDGNVSWDKPDRSPSVFYRVLVLAKDGDGADAIYFAKWLPKAQVTEMGEQMWGEETEVQYPVTLSAFVDPEVGTSARTLWAGPSAVLESMGFEA